MSKGKRLKPSNRQLKKLNSKVNSSGLDSDASQTIIYSTIIVLIIVIFGALIFTKMRSEPHVLGFENQNVWEESFKEVENNRVGVIFDSVSTSESEYNELRVKSNEYLEDMRVVKDEIHVGVDVVIDEQTFIDNSEDSNITSDAAVRKPNYSDTKVETGPLYFDDAILIRYINDNGELQTICSLYEDGTHSDIKVINQSGINADELNFDIVIDETIENTNNDKAISESEYAHEVMKCIERLLEADDVEQEREAVRHSLKYFTSDGKDTILKCRNLLNIKKSDDLVPIFLAVGKSDTSYTIKNRLYMKFELSDMILNVVVKMNSNLRVFDIDLL